MLWHDHKISMKNTGCISEIIHSSNRILVMFAFPWQNRNDCVPLLRDMPNDTEDIYFQVHQRLLARSLEVIISYPLLVYHSERKLKKECA
jgi:hypothetical protein